MMPELPKVIPIIEPSINWNDLVSTIFEQTKRSPTRLLTRQAGDLLSYLECLSSFSLEELDYKQLHFSFLMTPSKDEYFEIIKHTKLSFIDNLKSTDPQLVVIGSGSLDLWLDTCYFFASDNHSFNLRYIFDCIILFFEQRFKLIKFKKKHLPDKSFIIYDNTS